MKNVNGFTTRTNSSVVVLLGDHTRIFLSLPPVNSSWKYPHSKFIANMEQFNRGRRMGMGVGVPSTMRSQRNEAALRFNTSLRKPCLFFYYGAWLSDSTHIGPSAQVVWPIVRQEKIASLSSFYFDENHMSEVNNRNKVVLVMRSFMFHVLFGINKEYLCVSMH